MNTPISDMDALRIGIVDFVSPDEIKVLLDIEAPNDIALNTGIPRPFPRINSYVLIQGEAGYLVAQIEWITIERSQFPKRQGMKDFGLIDLPYPLRKMSVNPLGILKRELLEKNDDEHFVFSRGVEIFPTVGDPVILPTKNQLLAIVESGKNRHVNIGVSPMAGNAVVSVDPDRLFGRHLAVLGNTGSGKSCSVAGLIRWSIEAARECNNGEHNPARFIILDPNGEFTKAFSDFDCVRKYGVEENSDLGIEQLKVPIWLWNSNEWVAFTQASSKTQKPTLIQSLRTVRESDDAASIIPSTVMKSYLQTLVQILKIEIKAGSPWIGGGKSRGFKESLLTWKMGIVIRDDFTDDEKQAISVLSSKIDEFLESNTASSSEWPKYSQPASIELLNAFTETYYSFGGHMKDTMPIDADTPIPFSGEALIKSIEANAELMKTTEHVETMIMRIRTLLSDRKLQKVISVDDNLSLENWLDAYICPGSTSAGSITIFDLSLLPAELTFIVTSVIARITLECLQRYRRVNDGKILPITLVMEEAHTFIKRYGSDNEYEGATELCSKVFEKIAREGRKFGLGLVISSQRPSELSPTVLSQCNSFLLHRISNDKDQELVSKLIPDNLRGLLRELPSLPARYAILLGWVSELPVVVKMNELKEMERPRSDDPHFWDVWTKDYRIANWDEVVSSWQDERSNEESE